jgi:hypothetical protein
MGKLDVIKKLAGLGVAAGSASLISQEEAKAAGVATIAKKLGIALDEAKKIKELAHIAPPNMFEDNIKAIQKVTQYNKDPLAFPKLGSGVDYKALDIGNDQVLKVPKRTTEDTIERQVSPALLESVGLGPKTKTIQAGDRSFLIQDKVRPINDIIKKSQRPGQDQVIEDLYKVRDKLWSNVDISNPKAIEAVNQSPELKKIEDAILARENEILKGEGININELASEYDQLPFKDASVNPSVDAIHAENALESVASHRARKTLGDVITPTDTHSANIGLDKENQLKIFDSSRFENLKPNRLTPEMRESIMNSNISLPEKKEALRKLLNPDIKKAAAIAPIGASDMLSQGAEQVANVYDKYVTKPIGKVADYAADKLANATALGSEQGREANREIAAGGLRMALDPTNLLAPGVGIPLSLGAEYLKSPEQPTEEELREQAIQKLRQN